jgi:hypothetical protein
VVVCSMHGDWYVLGGGGVPSLSDVGGSAEDLDCIGVSWNSGVGCSFCAVHCSCDVVVILRHCSNLAVIGTNCYRSGGCSFSAAIDQFWSFGSGECCGLLFLLSFCASGF